VHRDLLVLQQLAQALDAVAHEVATHVVGMPVGHERARQPHVIGGEQVDQVTHAIGGIDDDGVSGLPVADQVHEVHHLPGDEVGAGEVSTSEKLTKVQAVAHESPWSVRLGSAQHAGPRRAGTIVGERGARPGGRARPASSAGQQRVNSPGPGRTGRS
jgi:hypothetical protein